MELGVHDANFKGLIRKLGKCATRKNFMQLLEGEYEVNAKNWLKILQNTWQMLERSDLVFFDEK